MAANWWKPKWDPKEDNANQSMDGHLAANGPLAQAISSYHTYANEMVNS